MIRLVGIVAITLLLIGLVVADSVDYNNILLHFGVGHNFSCQPIINTVLQTADEYNKAGMSSATTLITLIPTLLTIGNLYQPRSSEIFGTSWMVGILTAAFSLGLPVKSISAVPRDRIIDLRDLPTVDRDDIRRYGAAIQGIQRTLPRWEIQGSELHGWFLATHGRLVGSTIVNRPHDFRSLKARTHQCAQGKRRWHLPVTLLCLVQVALLAGVGFSATFLDLSQPYWACESTFNMENSLQVGTTIWWFFVSAILAVIFRTTQWSLSPHKLVHVHSLPHLTRFQGLVEAPTAITTTRDLPPISHRFRAAESIIQALHSCAHNLSSLTHPKATSHRRPRPLVIMVRLSLEAQSPLVVVFTGFIEALTLLLLTAFLASYWGGTVIGTLTLLIITLVMVTIGRMLGLVYVQWVSRTFGFTVVECYHQEEVQGVLRLLASMPDVLIETNGAQYLWGTRVDGHEAFRQWLGS